MTDECRECGSPPPGHNFGCFRGRPLYTASDLARAQNEARGVALREAKTICNSYFGWNGHPEAPFRIKEAILALDRDAARAAEELVAKAKEAGIVALKISHATNVDLRQQLQAARATISELRADLAIYKPQPSIEIGETV